MCKIREKVIRKKVTVRVLKSCKKRKQQERPGGHWVNMEKNDWQDQKNNNGSDFMKVVQDAINSGDYQQLNEQVRKTVSASVQEVYNMGGTLQNGIMEGMRQAGNGLQEGLKEGMNSAQREWRESANTGWKKTEVTYRTNYGKDHTPAYQAGAWKRTQQGKQLPAIYAPNPPGKITGTILAITGYSLTGVFALSTIVTGIVTAIYPGVPSIIATATVGGITAASLGMGITGTVIRGRVKRFRQYVQQIGDRAYCNIKELADKTGKTETKVRKDLKLMIEKRMFLQGHLDQKETCLIVTDAMYQQYLETEKQAKTVQMQQQQQKEQRSRMPEECRKILEEGQEYITYIHKCNDDLPGEEITRKLSRLETIITRIFQEVEKQPELASDLRRFMNYYLPTTRKLVDAYREIELDSFRTEQNEKTKKEIEDTLDTINQAFEKLLNSFFEERAMDISSDISVLHSMLAQEGLTQGAFEQKTGYKDQT